MFESGDKVLVAVSGGQDSVLLLHFLIQLKDVFDLSLHIFHLNHMLRGDDSYKDAVFVRDLAEKENLSSTILSYNVPDYIAKKNLSTEEGARKVRYMLLEKVAKDINADKVALGHTADDQVETFLMRILRGSGLKGLSAIPPVRGVFVRPLIEITRKEIESYCKSEGIDFRVDISNFDSTYLRNRVRRDLIPVLEQYNPDLRDTIFQTIRVVSDDNQYLDEIASKEFYSVSAIKNDLISFSLKKLKALPVAVKRRVLRKGIEILKGNLEGIEFKHLKDLLLDAEKMPKFRRDIPGNLAIIREYDNLILIRRNLLEKKKRVEVTLDGLGRIEIPELKVELKASIMKLEGDNFAGERFLKNKFLPSSKINLVAYFDADKIDFPISICNRSRGGRFYPLGLEGEKKLQDFFVDVKLPERLRDSVPIVTSFDGEIIWVVGYRIDDRFKVDCKTQRVLEIKAKFKNNM
ncbi:MAG TPA: tRNA lysidine(34) synthetase TilS [Actinobacteria bacterium]|nr:tRNA lysidine(34) synthetase TilS [Actinomycetota bacterium]